MPDAAGRRLSAAFRRDFTAGAAATDRWRIAPPLGGSRTPVTVSFPTPLDHALLERANDVRSSDGRAVTGRVGLAEEERTWSLTPDAAWRPRRYEVVVLTLLEDPAGNKIGRAFEMLTSNAPNGTADPEVARIPFEIK